MTAAAIDSTLALVGAEPLAFALAPILAGVTWDLTTMCNQDPPADPGLTQQDIIDAANIQTPWASGPAINKIYQWFKSWYWYLACQCIGSATPSPPTPSNPGNPISSNGGSPGFGQPSACWNVTVPFNVAARVGGATNTTQLDIGQYSIPQLGPTGTYTYSGGTTTPATVVTRPIPPAITQIQQVMTLNEPVTTGSMDATLNFLNSGGTVTRALSDIFLPSGHSVASIRTLNALVAGDVTWFSNVQNNDTVAHSGNVTISFYCGANSPLLTPSCCPPDPSMLQLLNTINRAVQLIQRQQVPFAYVHGSTHTAITGHGQFAVQGLLGAKLTPAAIPPWAGVAVGDPDTLWLESWINWGNPDGWTAREFLRSSPYVSLPNYAGQFTLFGYSLAPGLSVDITELVREP